MAANLHGQNVKIIYEIPDQILKQMVDQNIKKDDLKHGTKVLNADI